MAARCGDVHGPMASAGNVGLAAFLDVLERAVMPRRRVMSAVRGADELLEFVVEAFVAKIPLLFRYPFLQPEMRLNLELRHGADPLVLLRATGNSRLDRTYRAAHVPAMPEPE